MDPRHARELRAQADAGAADAPEGDAERKRRIRDAVEAALSDVMLLGTAEQVRLAVQAASDMVAGRQIETAALVVSLRNFIREVLELDAVPADLAVPKQGPVRGAGAGGGRGGGANAGGRSGGGGGGGGGAGMAVGGGLGLGAGRMSQDDGALAGPDVRGP